MLVILVPQNEDLAKVGGKLFEADKTGKKITLGNCGCGCTPGSGSSACNCR